MTALDVLWQTPDAAVAGGESRRTLAEPLSLVHFYGGPLSIALHADRPTIVANFVTTLDGVASFNEPGAAGGGPISGRFGPDRRLMGLLRVASDVVLLGAGTVRGSPRGGWTARDVDPELAADYGRARRTLGLAPQPTTVIVTSSGDLDVSRHGLARPDVPVMVLTTTRGLAKLPAGSASERVSLVAAGDAKVETAAMIGDLHARGARLVICEGGPHLLGQLLADNAVDELFLTIAPQVAGRSAESHRLALVEGQAFSVPAAPWSSLVSVRRAGSHLFLRYRFDRGNGSAR